MFLISHFGNPKDFNFRRVLLLAKWFVIFLFEHNCANSDFFFHFPQHCVYCVDPMTLFLYRTSIRGASVAVR